MTGVMDFGDSDVEAVLGCLALTRFAGRNVALFTLGIETGFRITELLSVCISDVYDGERVRDTLTVARKNMKRKREGRSIQLSVPAQTAIRVYLDELHGDGYWYGDDYLFQSARNRNAAISRTHAWQILHDAARAAGVTSKVGTHSMRKTFARRYYEWLLDQHANHHRSINPLRELSKALGHKSIDSTEKYISWSDAILSEYISARQ